MKIVFATSERKDGSMGFISEPDSKAAKNHSRFLHKLGIDPKRVVRAGLAHTATVRWVSRIPTNSSVPNTDALITSQPNTFLSIRHADCFPVFFYDTSHRVAGIAHAGWRGVVNGIAPNVIQSFRAHHKIDAKHISIHIGPGIRKCHYEVWPRTRHKGIAVYARKYPTLLLKRGRRVFADLEDTIRYQAIRAGVPSRNIHTARACTYHLPRRYFSYRRDANSKHPRGLGNMLSVIGIKT